MHFKIRHISLLTGILMIILSFLFFGRATGTYNIIILCGVFISLIAYLFILLKDSTRNKLIWTLIVFAGIGLQWLTEPLIIRLSYLIFIRQNEIEFSKVNQLLIAKPNNAIWVQDPSLWKRNGINEEEGKEIKKSMKNKSIFRIEKDSIQIYYQTFGMLDVSQGLYYFYSSQKIQKGYNHIVGNWYY